MRENSVILRLCIKAKIEPLCFLSLIHSSFMMNI